MNTSTVRRFVEANGVVAVKADYTSGSEEITSLLAELSSKSIPLVAILPADEPNRVYLLRDLITKGQVIRALEQAGPSRTRTAAVP